MEDGKLGCTYHPLRSLEGINEALLFSTGLVGTTKGSLHEKPSIQKYMEDVVLLAETFCKLPEHQTVELTDIPN